MHVIKSALSIPDKYKLCMTKLPHFTVKNKTFNVSVTCMLPRLVT